MAKAITFARSDESELCGIESVSVCVLHALSRIHINSGITPFAGGCVTSLRRQGLRMIKPRLRHIHVQGAAGAEAGVCGLGGAPAADNLE
jgi:hypothetical protein